MSKVTEYTTISTTEADELRVIVSELNENIACLSKMMLQLQKSIAANTETERSRKGNDTKKPKVFH